MGLHSRPVGHCLAALVESQSRTRAFAAEMAAALVEQKSTHAPVCTQVSSPLEQVHRVVGLAKEQMGWEGLKQSLSDVHVPAGKAAQGTTQHNSGSKLLLPKQWRRAAKHRKAFTSHHNTHTSCMQYDFTGSTLSKL